VGNDDEQAQAKALAAVKEALHGARGSLARVLGTDSHHRLEEILRPPMPQIGEFQHDFRLLRALDRLSETQRDALSFALFEVTDQQRDVLDQALRVLSASGSPAGD